MHANIKGVKVCLASTVPHMPLLVDVKTTPKKHLSALMTIQIPRFDSSLSKVPNFKPT